MDIAKALPLGCGMEQKPNQGDFRKDGLLYCGKCRKAKQKVIMIPGLDAQKRIVAIMCDCEIRKMEEEEKREKYEEQLFRIERLRTASMMPGKYREATFSNYEVRPENEKAYKYARRYVAMFREMEEKNQGLLLYGPVGTGKSYTAACIANALMEKEIPVVMTSFVKILQDIQMMNKGESGYLDTLNAARLLIIDDLGAERDTVYALEKVYNVIDSRIRKNRPLILTTNLKVVDMMHVADIRYKRIYDRILEVCFPVEVNGSSFRMRQAAERQEAMRRLFEQEGGTE